MPEPRPVVVLGLGNILLSDDGIGVAAVHELDRRFEVPPGVRLLDGGTLGLSLLAYIEHARHLILVDAVQAEGPPGTPVRLDGAQVPPAVATRLSPHQIGVSDLLMGATWLERYPAEVVLLGLVPASLSLGMERTPEVERALPSLVDAVVDELTRIGHAPTPRAGLGERVPERTHAARALGL